MRRRDDARPTRPAPWGIAVCALLAWLAVATGPWCGVQASAEAADREDGRNSAAGSGASAAADGVRAARGELRAVGAGGRAGHLWIVAEPAPGEGGGWRLLHHHPTMAGALRVAWRSDGPPMEIAAWGDRVWIVFAPPLGAATSGEPWTMRVRRSAALGTWFNDPPDRLELLPALPAGRLESFVATADGPLALLRDPPGRRLLRLGGGAWIDDEPLPDAAVAAAGRLHLIAGGSDGRTLMLVGRGTRTGTLEVHARIPRGRWTRFDEPLEGELVGWARVGESPLLLLRAGDGAGRIMLLRPGGATPLASIELPPEPSGFAGVGDGLRVVDRDDEGRVRLRPLDPTDGRIGAAISSRGEFAPGARRRHLPLLGALGVAALLVLLIFRSDAVVAPAALPAGVAIASIPRRLGAMAIDYGLAALFVLLVTGCEAIDLLTLPIWTVEIDRALPSMLALALMCAATGVSEAVTGATVGKRLVGLRVIRPDGSKPGVVRSVLRAPLKFAVLALPLLAILHLINPARRGLPDVTVDVVVVE